MIALVVAPTPNNCTPAFATRFVVRKLGICDKQRQESSSGVKLPIRKTRKQVKDAPMKPIVRGTPPAILFITSAAATCPQLSWDVRLNRLGAERAWTTERRAVSGTSERMLETEEGVESERWRRWPILYVHGLERPVAVRRRSRTFHRLFQSAIAEGRQIDTRYDQHQRSHVTTSWCSGRRHSKKHPHGQRITGST